MTGKRHRFTADFKKRVAMVERGRALSLSQQRELLGVSRAWLYGEPATDCKGLRGKHPDAGPQPVR